jgi:hypothetical protein
VPTDLQEQQPADPLTFEGDDSELVPFVLSPNLHRRHLTESQRAMVAAKVATLGKGRPEENAEISALKQAEAAKLLNVSRGSIQNAARVQRKGVPDLVEEVEKGNIPVSTAADIAQLHPTEQQKIVADVKAGKHCRPAGPRADAAVAPTVGKTASKLASPPTTAAR